MSVHLSSPPVEVEVQAEQPRGLANSAMLESRLASHIKHCWQQAKTAKMSGVTERLLKCERQRRGEYDAEHLAAIRQQGGSEIYMMLTDIKCRAAASWIRDVTGHGASRQFSLEPANNPDIPLELKMSIRDMVQFEAEEFLMLGHQLHPEALRLRLEEVRDTVMLRLREEAKEKARRMEGVIADQLQEGKFDPAYDDFVENFVTFPTAILKGPNVRRKKKLAWGPDFTPVVVSDLIRDVRAVSPYDIYPSPNSSGPDDGYLLERHRLTPGALSALIGVPGYDEKEVKAALAHYGASGLRYTEHGDSERDSLAGRSFTMNNSDRIIEALEFWGAVPGSFLIQWGLKDKRIDPTGEYEINAWLVGNYVIKAAINPDPLGERPYEIASWERIPGSFWGKGLPEIMRDLQMMCNASARALANNMGIASGPQVEVHVDRLAAGEDVTSMYPWKLWQTTSDKTGGGQSAIRFFQPDMKAQELMAIYQSFAKQADEVTGIPNYVYGSGSVGGAGRTASGLSMLMDNAAKGIKSAIVTLDKVVEGIVKRYYIHNMIHHPDASIKGDFKIVAKGAFGLIVREQLQIRRNEFLMQTANPIDLQIIGMEGRAYMLRETAEGLQYDTDKIVPQPEMLKYRQQKMLEAQTQAAQEAQAQQQQLPRPSTTDAAGNAAGGAEASLVQ